MEELRSRARPAHRCLHSRSLKVDSKTKNWVPKEIYDAVGNRTARRVGNRQTAYGYDAAHQLASAGTGPQSTSYTYDAAGRRTAQQAGNKRTDFAYDAAGLLKRLTSTTGAGQPWVDNRTLDGDGALVGVAVTDPSGATSTTTAVWDPTREVPEIVVQASAGPGSSTTADLIYGAGRALALTGSVTSVFSYDAHRSAVRTDTTAGLVRANRYDEYGVPGDDADHPPSRFGYRGETNVEGLVHLRARDYDPTTGTFLSKDPLDGVDGEVTVANPYHYAGNDPLNQVDPLGKRPTDAAFSGPIPITFCVVTYIDGVQAAKTCTSQEFLVGKNNHGNTTTRVDTKDKTEAQPNKMRFQVQWDTGFGGPTFSAEALAPAARGVTVAQAAYTLSLLLAEVTPGTARKAAAPAVVAANKWMAARPPDGIGVVMKKSFRFAYLKTRGSRVDVENEAGTNLRTLL